MESSSHQSGDKERTEWPRGGPCAPGPHLGGRQGLRVHPEASEGVGGQVPAQQLGPYVAVEEAEHHVPVVLGPSAPQAMHRQQVRWRVLFLRQCRHAGRAHFGLSAV